MYGQSQRRNIGLGVVGQIFVDHRIVDQRARDRNTKGIAIGFGLGDQVGAYIAAGTGLVLHHNGLLERFARLLCHGPGHGVGAGACTKRHDERQRLAWPFTLRIDRRTGCSQTQ